MDSILSLFSEISSYVAIGTLLLPIIASVIARRKNVKFVMDLKLFEFYVYLTFILQIYALVLVNLGEYNIFLFRLYLPFHTVVFTYFLLKWLLGLNKNTFILVSFSLFISIIGDFFLDESNNFPYFMLLFDSVLLVILSFIVSFFFDKRKHHLPNEYNYIHIGIYLYSLITLIGFLLTQTGYFKYGFFIQAVAIVISNYYFTRSFVCLFRSRG